MDIGQRAANALFLQEKTLWTKLVLNKFESMKNVQVALFKSYPLLLKNIVNITIYKKLIWSLKTMNI